MTPSKLRALLDEISDLNTSADQYAAAINTVVDLAPQLLALWEAVHAYYRSEDVSEDTAANMDGRIVAALAALEEVTE